MGAIVDPITRRSDPLARGDRGRMANHGDQVSVAPCLDADNTKAVIGVLVRDALDQASNDSA
jgi:hypothetical protein